MYQGSIVPHGSEATRLALRSETPRIVANNGISKIESSDVRRSSSDVKRSSSDVRYRRTLDGVLHREWHRIAEGARKSTRRVVEWYRTAPLIESEHANQPERPIEALPY